MNLKEERLQWIGLFKSFFILEIEFFNFIFLPNLKTLILGTSVSLIFEKTPKSFPTSVRISFSAPKARNDSDPMNVIGFSFRTLLIQFERKSCAYKIAFSVKCNIEGLKIFPLSITWDNIHYYETCRHGAFHLHTTSTLYSHIFYVKRSSFASWSRDSCTSVANFRGYEEPRWITDRVCSTVRTLLESLDLLVCSIWSTP